MKIPLIKPFINKEIKELVRDVLESGYLTEGPMTQKFEEAFQEYIGCSSAISVTSCTTGLEIALRCLEIGPGDEVIVPDYTYPATASVGPVVGATSVIVDIDSKTMLIDYDAIEKAITEKTKAIIPVSGFGNPLNYDRLNEIKEKHGIYIIEDAACAIGAEYKQEKVGNQADISVFSLHPRKFITTGEGGMIVTNNKKWAQWINSFKHFGMNMDATGRETTQFEIIGTNSKMSNLLGAVGYGQMKHIDELLAKRRELVANYKKLLSGSSKIRIPETTKDGVHSHQSFTIFIENRDEVMRSMRSDGIEVQIGTYALHMHKAFQNSELCKLKENYPNSRFAFDHCLTLPLYNELSFKEQEYIVEKLTRLVE